MNQCDRASCRAIIRGLCEAVNEIPGLRERNAVLTATVEHLREQLERVVEERDDFRDRLRRLRDGESR